MVINCRNYLLNYGELNHVLYLECYSDVRRRNRWINMTESTMDKVLIGRKGAPPPPSLPCLQKEDTKRVLLIC